METGKVGHRCFGSTLRGDRPQTRTETPRSPVPSPTVPPGTQETKPSSILSPRSGGRLCRRASPE